MHGVRSELIERQAKVLGIPVTFVNLPDNPSMKEYDSIMKKEMRNLIDQGFTHCAFGDIFLEDLKKYREENIEKVGMKPLFPIWKENTNLLAQSFIDEGFKAILACVDSGKSISKYAGKLYSKSFIDEISDNIDPCGENGEFHTFVFDGPIFSEPISYQKKEIVEREYPSPEGKGKMVFRFCDLLPD